MYRIFLVVVTYLVFEIFFSYLCIRHFFYEREFFYGIIILMAGLEPIERAFCYSHNNFETRIFFVYTRR